METDFNHDRAGHTARLKDTGEKVTIEFDQSRHPAIDGPASIVRKCDGSDEQLVTRRDNLTPTKEQIQQLINDLTGAVGPDNELNAHLHCIREGLEFVFIGDGKTPYGSICDPSDSGYGTGNTTTSGYLYARYPDEKNPPTLGGGKRGNKVQGCTPANFTGSYDAAISLFKDSPYRRFEVGTNAPGDSWAYVHLGDDDRVGDAEACHSEPIALCVAYLMVLAARLDAQEREG